VRVSHRKSFAGQAAFSNPPCPLPIVQRRGRPIGQIGVLMGYPENDLEGPAFFAAIPGRDLRSSVGGPSDVGRVVLKLDALDRTDFAVRQTA
jgi:hypothetical protein